MKVYRLSFRRADGEHTGYWFTDTKHDALTIKHQNELPIPEEDGEKFQPKSVEIECFKLSVTKWGVVSALNKYASHADNG